MHIISVRKHFHSQWEIYRFSFLVYQVQEELEKNLKDGLSLKNICVWDIFRIGKFAWLAKTVLCFKMNILHAVITYVWASIRIADLVGWC